MRNTNGLKRDAGPGRPKGTRNKVPASFKASVRDVFEQIATDDPEIVKAAILKGLKGKPREAFPYVQLAAHYIDGKPADTVNINSKNPAPCIVVLPAGLPSLDGEK